MATAKYRYVGHTADVKFVAFGGSMQELFQNAALALFNTSADTGALKRAGGRTVRLTIRVSARDYEDLLWKTLQRCLSVADIRGVFCYRMSRPVIRKVRAITLTATAYGKERDARYSRLEAKGVSKYELWIGRARRGYRASAVVDV